MEDFGYFMEALFGTMIVLSGWVLGLLFIIFMVRGKKVFTVVLWSGAAIISLLLQKGCAVKFQGLKINSGDGRMLAMDKFSPALDGPIIACSVLSAVMIIVAIHRNRSKDDCKRSSRSPLKVLDLSPAC